VISLENKKTLKKIMFSNAQKRCLLNIIDIISAANECHLFNYYDDVEKTLFNNYLLGLTPILNKFYDKLINLRLPKQLNEIISNSPENMEKKSFLFGGKKILQKILIISLQHMIISRKILMNCFV